MRVGFFSDALANGKQFGLGRYAKELLAALREQDSAFDFAHLATKPSIEQGAQSRYISGSRRLNILRWRFLNAPKIESWIDDVELIHQLEPGFPISTRLPWVLTVHDIGPLTHPQFFSQSRPWLMRACLERAIKEAVKIVCVSHATAAELQSYFQVDLGDQVTVIHEGVNAEDFANRSMVGDEIACSSLQQDCPFFLWTGSLSPRKNLDRVISAFESVADSIEQHLVLTGDLHWDYDETIARINRSKYSARIHRLGYVSESDLIALYHNADAYLYPSLLEGFGLPILEAMACGCPVITSNLSSMPEVCGDAGVKVDPYSVEQLSDAMKDIANNESARSEYSRRGLERITQFTWNGCAAEMLRVYQQVIQ